MTPALSVLKRRADFLAAAKSGFKCSTPSLTAQARKRQEDEICVPAVMQNTIRTGFTATKALGGAVVRNRAKRRLKAAAVKLVCEYGAPDYDYVFIAREGAHKGTFDDLIRDMKHALKRLSEMMR